LTTSDDTYVGSDHGFSALTSRRYRLARWFSMRA
jgi:hypothetical protein